MFCHCFTWDHWISANHNPELRGVICTGVTRFAPVLHVLHWCYTFCTGVTLKLHCSQPIRIEKFFHVHYYYTYYDQINEISFELWMETIFLMLMNFTVLL